jgi:hypothetical protein
MAADFKNAMVKISGPDLMALRNAFKDLPRNIAARVIGAGLKRASAPMVAALKETTPKGPTGNLRRAIKTVVKRYPRDGAAVAVVGYQKAGTGSSKSAAGGRVKRGSDRAFHQFWLEFGGKKDRIISKKAARGGFVASSYNSLGPFKLKAGSAGRVVTTPTYPRAFFLKRTEPINLGMIVAQRPVRAAFAKSRRAVEANLFGEMTKALQNGIKIVEYNAQKKADMAKLAGYL